MSRKNQNILTAEVCIQGNTEYSEHEHLLEHVHFLEERVGILEEVFRDLLDDEEEDDADTEYEEDNEDNKLEENDRYGHAHHCVWGRIAN